MGILPQVFIICLLAVYVSCATVFTNNCSSSYEAPHVIGIRVEEDGVGYKDGAYVILANVPVPIRLFGRNFSNDTSVRFTKEVGEKGDDCSDYRSGREFRITSINPEEESITVEAIFPSPHDGKDVFLICIRENRTQGCATPWMHQGSSNWLKVKAYEKFLPFWAQCLAVFVLLVFSGLFAGLTLGLLALDQTDLKILANTGSDKERMYAKAIIPLRMRGNYLLCSLVLGNVLVNSTLTIILDDLTTGLIAVATSTTCIMIFGEIIPQAICSRHGLAVGAKTIYIMRFFMVVTFPLAWPLSTLLDKLLGEEIGSVYTRERLKELLKVTKDHHGLENEEVALISGALNMKNKTVRDIMTKLESVFMLPLESNLDYDTVAEIEYQGFTRIPVFEKSRSNVVAVLNVKQLTLLDACDNIPIRTVVEYYQNSLFYVFENTRLDYMFRVFREGNRGHMAFVQRVNDDGPGDPFYETIGVVTMEDVLEELLQADILDETDVGKFKARFEKRDRPQDIPFLSKKRTTTAISVPPPLALAAVQFLTTAVPAFKRELISENILNRLVKTTVALTKPPSQYKDFQKQILLYECGKPSDQFIMVLEGRVQVEVGKENLTFQAGPFQCFGSEFLMTKPAETTHDKDSIQADINVAQKHCFIPDYTVRVVSETFYMKVRYSVYCAAKIATQLEMKYDSDPKAASDNRNWRKEVEDILTVGDEDSFKHQRRMLYTDSQNEVSDSDVEPAVAAPPTPSLSKPGGSLNGSFGNILFE